MNRKKLKKEDEGGIYLYPDIIADERLNWFDKALLSLYRSYTKYGQDKCLHMQFEKLNQKHFEGKLNKTNYHRAKRKLKELGLIVTDGGIVTKTVEGGVKNDTPPVSKMTPPRVKNDTHNI